MIIIIIVMMIWKNYINILAWNDMKIRFRYDIDKVINPYIYKALGVYKQSIGML